MKTKRWEDPAAIVRRQVPVDTVLERLDEIVQGSHAECRLYYADAGLMIEWRTSALILSSKDLKNLMKVAGRVDGELYVTAAKVDANVNRRMDVPIRGAAR